MVGRQGGGSEDWGYSLNGVHTFGNVNGTGGFVRDGDVRDVYQLGGRNGSAGHACMVLCVRESSVRVEARGVARV